MDIFRDAGILVTVTVTNLFPGLPGWVGRPSPRALKPRLRYKLNHGVVGGVYYNLSFSGFEKKY